MGLFKFQEEIMGKRLLALALSLVLLAGLFPEAVRAEERQVSELENRVEKQIRAYVDSVDQSKAEETAAMTLATHGIFGGGRKLTLNEKDALTAMMLNSELLQTTLIEGCMTAIQNMQNFGLTAVNYVYGGITWGLWPGDWDGAARSNYYLNLYSNSQHDTPMKTEDLDRRIAFGFMPQKQANSYDDALSWMVSFASLQLQLQVTQVTEQEATYQITLLVTDRFDFHTASNGGFDQFVSGFGDFMFREFDWSATITFPVTVPYSCNHTAGNYHWTYDGQNLSFTEQENTAENPMTRREAISGGHYYELDSALQLRHTEPWVMELDVVNPGRLVLTAFETFTVAESTPCLLIDGLDALLFWNMEFDGIPESSNFETWDFLGTPLEQNLSDKRCYTIRLENYPKPDGKNMVYLTVLEESTGLVILNRVPMDDHYQFRSDNPVPVLLDTEDTGLSGQDFVIKYIGNKKYPVDAERLALRVWERGENGEPGDYFTPFRTEADCVNSGGSGVVCAHCGYRKYDAVIPAAGHSFGVWVAESEATCIRVGKESRKCATCGYSESREVPALGHDNVETRIEPSCTDEGYVILDCRRCGKSEIGGTLEPLEHTYEGGKCIRCGHESEYFVDFVSTSVSLGGNIAMHFYAVLSENLLLDESAYIQFTYGNNTRTVPLSEGEISVKNGVTRYMYSCPITSKNMTDTITAQIYTANGPVGESQSDDVRAYSSWLAENIQDKELEELLHAMLNYGAAAQIQFNYKTNDLANSLLDEEDKILKYADLSEFEMNRSCKDDGIKNTAATMLLDSETVIRIYYVLTGDKTIEDYTFRIDGVEVEPQYQESRDRYYVELPNIGAHELDEMHVFTVGDEIFHYGPMSYVYDVLTYDPEGSTIYNMALALYAYSVAAENYIK